MSTPRDVVPEDVRTELVRAVRRWQQLPLDRALASAPGVHALLAEIAGQPLPDLGPAVIPDQLAVVVYDACADDACADDACVVDGPAQEAGTPGHDGTQEPALAARLAALRLSWS